MKACYITFRSVTPAQRGEKILRRAGISCVVQRTPRWMEEQGCGYSLRLNGQSAQAALRLLKSSGVAYRKAYVKDGDKGFEELTV